MIFKKHQLFALECVDILTREYGARRAGIDIGHFYYTSMGQEIGHVLDVKPMQTPSEMVERAYEILWPWVLGLAPATPARQAKIDAAWLEIAPDERVVELWPADEVQ